MRHVVVMWFQFNEACNARIQESDTAIDESAQRGGGAGQEGKNRRGRKRRQRRDGRHEATSPEAGRSAESILRIERKIVLNVV
jgi:hypothetical protein